MYLFKAYREHLRASRGATTEEETEDDDLESSFFSSRKKIMQRFTSKGQAQRSYMNENPESEIPVEAMTNRSVQNNVVAPRPMTSETHPTNLSSPKSPRGRAFNHYFGRNFSMKDTFTVSGYI